MKNISVKKKKIKDCKDIILFLDYDLPTRLIWISNLYLQNVY